MKENNEDNIIDVQKNYPEEVIQEIQNAIDSNISNIKVLTCINDLPRTLYIDNTKMVLTHIGDRYDSCLYVDYLMNKEDVKKWKTESAYAFFHKDWKRLNKNIDIFKNDNYIEIFFNVKDAEFIALLRRVDIELANNTFALMEYGEICYNNAQYTIIKAFSPSIKESYSTKSMLENVNCNEKIYDDYGSEITVNTDGYNVSSIDDIDSNIDEIPDPESEELF